MERVICKGLSYLAPLHGLARGPRPPGVVTAEQFFSNSLLLFFSTKTCVAYLSSSPRNTLSSFFLPSLLPSTSYPPQAASAISIGLFRRVRLCTAKWQCASASERSYLYSRSRAFSTTTGIAKRAREREIENRVTHHIHRKIASRQQLSPPRLGPCHVSPDGKESLPELFTLTSQKYPRQSVPPSKKKSHTMTRESFSDRNRARGRGSLWEPPILSGRCALP